MTTQGTPKTLREAIENGIMEAVEVASATNVLEGGSLSPRIETHIRDYLAQRFGPAYLSSPNDQMTDALIQLWQSIFPDVKEKHHEIWFEKTGKDPER